MQILEFGQNKLDELNLVCQTLKQGDLVVIPTETVYGLAADATNSQAVSKIFEVKGRPQDNPLIVHISSLEMLKSLVKQIPARALKLAAKFWPGPLTLILKDAGLVAKNITCGLDTIAIRMPSHPMALEIISKFGKPLAAPSANISGRPSPTIVEHCVFDLGDQVEIFVDGGRCEFGLESTVLSLVDEPPMILRPGAITRRQLGIVLSEMVAGELEEGKASCSPGTRYKHYSPKTSVIAVTGSFKKFKEYVNGQDKAGCCAMVFEGESEGFNCAVLEYGKESLASSLAHNFFAALRSADLLGVDVIYVRMPPQNEENAALYDRLIRAASFRNINLKN